MISRRCSRAGCGRSAAATLTYVYADSTAVLGPLALRAEPGCYDLCDEHAGRLSAPRGWEVIRLPSGTTDQRAGTDIVRLGRARAVIDYIASFTDAQAIAVSEAIDGRPDRLWEIGHTL